MDEENKCGTCIFHKKIAGEWICDNQDADGYGFETDYNDGCKQHEER